MKTVTIPEGMNPFVVYSNGVKYVYAPGETVEVPDGVAIEIEEYRDAQNKKPGAVDAPFDSDCCDSGAGGGGTVHIGAEAPTDNAALWVDTDEEGAIPWDAISNKPFGEETTVVNEPLNITWDGNTEGLVSAMDVFYKVSDFVLTDEQILSVTLTFDDGSSLSASENCEKLSDDVSAVGLDPGAMFVKADNAVVFDVTFPEAGIYFKKIVDGYVASLTTEPIEQTKTVVKKLDPKFIPGNTVYYSDLTYLYHDSSFTNKVTKDELKVASQHGTIYVYSDSYVSETISLNLALHVYVDSGQGYVKYMYPNTTDWATAYTSEYSSTGPT